MRELFPDYGALMDAQNTCARFERWILENQPERLAKSAEVLRVAGAVFQEAIKMLDSGWRPNA